MRRTGGERRFGRSQRGLQVSGFRVGIPDPAQTSCRRPFADFLPRPHVELRFGEGGLQSQTSSNPCQAVTHGRTVSTTMELNVPKKPRATAPSPPARCVCAVIRRIASVPCDSTDTSLFSCCRTLSIQLRREESKEG